jgi:hypothetical protein
VQTSPPSERVEESATGRRVTYAIGLGLIVAIALIATNRTESLQTNPSIPAHVSSAAESRLLEPVEPALENREDTVRVNVASSAQQPRRSYKLGPVFDSAARAELLESVRASMQASLTRLGDEFSRSGEN